MSLELREARPADKDDIRKLLARVKLPAESVNGDVTTFYIAEEANRIAGIAGFEFYGSDALLRSVAIPPELQRRGIGSRIVDLMIEEARRKNVCEIVLLTETARDFFLAKGFQSVDRSTIVNEAIRLSSQFSYACPTSAVCMIMKLK